MNNVERLALIKSADFLPKPGEGSHRLFYPGSGFSKDVPEKDILKVYGRGNTLKKRLSSSLKGFAVGAPIAALITALATRSSSRPYGDIADTARFGLKGGLLAGLGNLAHDEYKDHRDYEKSLSKSAFNIQKMNNKEKLYLVKQSSPHAAGSVGAFFEPQTAAPETYAALPTAKGGLQNIPPRPPSHPLSKKTVGEADPKAFQNTMNRMDMGLPVTKHQPYEGK